MTLLKSTLRDISATYDISVVPHYLIEDRIERVLPHFRLPFARFATIR